MRPRHRSSSEAPPSRTPGLPEPRQLVLVLSGARADAEVRPFTVQSRHRADHLITVEQAEDEPGGPWPAGEAAALGIWRQIGTEFSSACLGIVAEAGAAAAAVARILAQGFEDGSLPGAVALLGYHPGIEAACLRPARGTGSDGPAIVVVLPADEPRLADCASACRRMRSAGLDVRLEIRHPVTMPGRSSELGTLSGDLVTEMDAFFEAKLDPCFPTMPRTAS